MILKDTMRRLLTGPVDPSRTFTVGGHTYGQIFRLAGVIREMLAQHPAADGSVGLITEDRGLLIAALLAAAGGGPALVLPYALSPRGIAESMGATGADLAITDGAGKLPRGVTGLVPAIDPKRMSPWTAVTQVDLDREIVRLYTGGSTGKPKIWTKSAANLFGEACYLAQTYGLRSRDRIVATVPSYHIYGLLFTVLAPFIAGAQVVDRAIGYPAEIAAALEAVNPTVFVSVPMHYRVLNGQSLAAPGLRIAFSSAGALDPADGASFTRQTGVGVTEIYGSTETGGIAARCLADGDTAFKPFETVDWKLRGDRLAVRSAYLSRELPLDKKGFFMVGDRVQAQASGFVLKGRADGVVKVGGKRVDLNEIKDRVMQVPQVLDAVALSQPATGRENEIVIVFEGEVDSDTVKRHLDATLEPYARPRAVKKVGRIPLTDAGKYDRRRIEDMLSGKTAPTGVRASGGADATPEQ